MPKNQSTAAQSARRASQSGGKHTEALRGAATNDAPSPPHVLRFLAKRSLYHLVGGIAAAWAYSGQRVLLLEEAEHYWPWTMRPRSARGAARKRSSRPPGRSRRPARCGPRRTAPAS
ncbi:hypothetical protein [Streptomyces sp. NRRL S-1521]|uniref:hypothetical protein n=1 Tax=Streptomyces sp. NRRL S-1521 TaxID=1609100 RepID=UPI000B2E47AF|nr:hypothetical protein [Streptomyces sp. NRRL S-1521]